VPPCMTEPTMERISREFDELGPVVCMVDIRKDLDRHNPELLDMAIKWAHESKDSERLLTSFGMFYRIRAAEALAPLESRALSPLPRVSSATRGAIVARIDRIGDEEFSREWITNLEASNPELLQMAYNFASERADYAHTMQGFALLHEALLAQWKSDRRTPH
jgi:hypothetical protein